MDKIHFVEDSLDLHDNIKIIISVIIVFCTMRYNRDLAMTLCCPWYDIWLLL